FTVTATASSNLAVSFAASGACTISSSTVHLTGAGSCAITASQAGDSQYAAAADVTQSFTIAKANANINVTPYSVTYDGNAHTATGTAAGVGGANLSAGLNLTGTTHTDAGTYNGDAWTFTGSPNYNDVNGTVNDSIAKATPVVTAIGGTFTYDAT